MGHEGQPVKKEWSTFTWWSVSQVVDYTALILMYLPYYPWAYEGRTEVYQGWELVGIMALQGTLSVLIYYLRERVHFWLLGSKAAAAKTSGPGTTDQTKLAIHSPDIGVHHDKHCHYVFTRISVLHSLSEGTLLQRILGLLGIHLSGLLSAPPLARHVLFGPPSRLDAHTARISPPQDPSSNAEECTGLTRLSY